MPAASSAAVSIEGCTSSSGIVLSSVGLPNCNLEDLRGILLKFLLPSLLGPAPCYDASAAPDLASFVRAAF